MLMSRYIVTTGGGLGNQIMTYALWYYLSRKSKAILYLRKNDLNKIFPLSCASTLPNKFIDIYIAFYKRYTGYLSVLLKRSSIFDFLKFLKLPLIVVDYPEWNDYLFWEDIREEMKRCLSFMPDNNIRNIKLLNRIRECNSVSIHVRRGDYQNNVYWRLMLGDICDEIYYNQAIDRVSKLVSNPVYFVFSDDISWVKDNLRFDNAVFVDWNVKEESYRDIQLMSCCKINILANSTFSLVSTWLNSNLAPIRIVPSKWTNFYNDDLLNKYIPKDWIVLDNKKPMVSIIIKDEISFESIKNLLKQSFTDYEIICNSDQYNNMDPRTSTLQPSGKFYYIYNSYVDNLNFIQKGYLHNWLSKILQKEITNSKQNR